MDSDGLEARWRELSQDVTAGMAEWRAQYPKATLREIETALDERLGRMRARMLQDAALASHATDIRRIPADERPRCSKCGSALIHQSWAKRDLLTHHGHTVKLERSYAICPTCGEAFFPSMTNWGCCPVTSHPACWRASLAWGRGCPLIVL